MVKGKGKLFSKSEKTLRAKAMLKKRITENKSVAQIADEFNVSKRTVERALSFAQRAELLVAEEDQVLEMLVPKARQALITALNSDDIEVSSRVALEIYKGAGVLRRGNGAVKSPAEVGDELSKYIERIRSQHALAGTVTDLGSAQALPPATAENGVLHDAAVRDAEVIGVPPRAPKLVEGSHTGTLEKTPIRLGDYDY